MITKDMLLPPRYVSSGSDGDGVIDMKKKRRMISNRESAKRSRMKKQRHLEDLIIEIDHLTKQNQKVVEKIDGLMQKHDSMKLDNDVLMAQKLEMEKRFDYLMNVLDNVERNYACHHHQGYYESFNVGLGESYIKSIDDVMMRPWQVSSTPQPIMASEKMFDF